MVNSRTKGAAGERELARLLREKGYGCRRGVQYHGGADSPDVIGLPGIHIECKRVERLNIDKAMEQARRDTGDAMPAVFHRRNGKKWLVTMELDDWLRIYTESVGDKR